MFLSLVSRLCLASDIYSEEERHQLSDAETYLRKQGLQSTGLLPGMARDAIGWFSGNWHPMQVMDDDQDASGGDADTPPPADGDPHAPQTGGSVSPLHLAGNFHHKGFLPTHDAAVLGLGMSRGMLDDKLTFSAHPFYGQNWRSLQGYWGTEMAMDIAQRGDGMPWGKIALGYVQGNQSLTDRGRGVDLHGDVDLTAGWRLTTGVKQSSAEGDSNYMLLRWRMAFQ